MLSKSEVRLSHHEQMKADGEVVMTSTPSKPADAYLGLLFCMEDMAL
jgi:hypothetical protein